VSLYNILDADDIRKLQGAPYSKILKVWYALMDACVTDAELVALSRDLAKHDRYFLLTQVLHRRDALHPWLYARCREVEADPDDHLDLWAREHYKSTIITFAGVIQEILKDPETTICIFSFNKPVARKFLRQIKFELESNADLKELFPDVLWTDPQKDSHRWSEDGGLIVRRSGNPKESTLEAHGLVDGQPTGAHYNLRVYDDVVTLESVTSPEMVQKTTAAWSLSDNLGAAGVDGMSRVWTVGTRYSFRDTYQDMLDMAAVKPRIYPATDTGLSNGTPVFLSPEVWAEKKRKQISSVLAAQMLQNPAAGNEATFKKEWLKFIDIRPGTLNVYILCDPASSRKKGSDRTAMPVIGIDAGGNKWLLDGYHHRMGLKERYDNLKALRKVWTNMPGVQCLSIGYERYGMTSDLEYFDEAMRRDKDIFEIHELAWPREGPGSKIDRVQRLEPDFRSGRFYMSLATQTETAAQRDMKERGQHFRVFTPVRRRDENGNVYSLNKNFIEEYLVFPFAAHDDLIDAVSRIYDIDAVPPILIDEKSLEPVEYADGM
jgi:phage terminase large subunit-like protein